LSDLIRIKLAWKLEEKGGEPAGFSMMTGGHCNEGKNSRSLSEKYGARSRSREKSQRIRHEEKG